MNIANCAGTGKPSSAGANGCQSYPADVQCCFTGVSNLEDDVAPEGAPAPYSSSMTSSPVSHTALIAGVVVSVLVIVAIIATAAFCVVLLRRRRNSRAYDSSVVDSTSSAISLKQETDSTGAPPRFI